MPPEVVARSSDHIDCQKINAVENFEIRAEPAATSIIDVDEELLSRCVVLSVDEGPALRTEEFLATRGSDFEGTSREASL